MTTSAAVCLTLCVCCAPCVAQIQHMNPVFFMPYMHLSDRAQTVCASWLQKGARTDAGQVIVQDHIPKVKVSAACRSQADA